MATTSFSGAVVILMCMGVNEAFLDVKKGNASVLPDYEVEKMTAGELARLFEESLKEEHNAAEHEQLLEMQRKPKMKLVQPHVESATPSKSKPAQLPTASLMKPDSSVSQFEKDVTDLVIGLSKAASGGNVMATPMGTTITALKSMIENDLLGRLDTAHSQAMTELDGLGKAVDKCGVTKSSSLTLAYSSETTYEAKSKVHKDCRKAEAGLYTDGVSCQQELKTSAANKKVECAALVAVEAEVGTTTTNQHIAQKAVGETTQSYVDRIHKTFCGDGGYKAKFDTAKSKCEKATASFKAKETECKNIDQAYKDKKAACDGIQGEMDGASCKAAIGVKDACEAYEECFAGAKAAYLATEKGLKAAEADRQKEFEGLKRMQCMIQSFEDGTVSDDEIAHCKDEDHSSEAKDKFSLSYYSIPAKEECLAATLYPGSIEYKTKEFKDLPTVAKGNLESTCEGLKAISTIPAKGSPSSCFCERVTLDGPYTAGALVKCMDCLPVSKTTDKISCPDGTKLFAPQSKQDWDTFLKSAGALGNPNWIIDITRPQNGCAGCTDTEMNSDNPDHSSWKTQDGEPWWLRSDYYTKSGAGDYTANCYMSLGMDIKKSSEITFSDGKCDYSSKDYYCQTIPITMAPAKGSPDGCTCTRVALIGEYSGKNLLKCQNCLDISKSKDKNSCPKGTKLWAPASAADWKTFLKSADRLADPSWIVDVTRPMDGCGGCTKFAMNSAKPEQASWVTSDGAPWWLRSSTYGEPSGDYTANCYLGLGALPASESAVTFSDGSCSYHSKSYYCQGKGAVTTK